MLLSHSHVARGSTHDATRRDAPDGPQFVSVRWTQSLKTHRRRLHRRSSRIRVTERAVLIQRERERERAPAHLHWPICFSLVSCCSAADIALSTNLSRYQQSEQCERARVDSSVRSLGPAMAFLWLIEIATAAVKSARTSSIQHYRKM